MKSDSWASLLARTFATPCFGHKPKVMVATHLTLLKDLLNNMTCISYIANPIITIFYTPPNNHYKKNMVFLIGEFNEKNPI
jgi:hypothetical protein